MLTRSSTARPRSPLRTAPLRVSTHPTRAPTAPSRRVRAGELSTFTVGPALLTGEAFVAAKIAQIKALVKAGVRVRVVFDIDDTLVDTRPRTLAIFRAFGEQLAQIDPRYRGAFDTLTVDDVLFDTLTTMDNASIAPPLTAEMRGALYNLWYQEFRNGKNYRFDGEMPSMCTLAKRFKDAGAELEYVTARGVNNTAFTIEQLKARGYPGVSTQSVVSKPDPRTPAQIAAGQLRVRNGAFKAEHLNAAAAQGIVTALMVTESFRDISDIQHLAPQIDCLLLDSPLKDGGTVAPGTPMYPRAVPAAPAEPA